MFALVLCLFALLATASLAQPAERESNEGPRFLEEPLCDFVRSATSRPQLEEEASARFQEEETYGEANLDQQPSTGPGNLPLFQGLRSCFQTTSHDSWRARPLWSRGRQALLPASVFGQWNASQRATIVGITHAMLNTQLMDSHDGK